MKFRILIFFLLGIVLTVSAADVFNKKISLKAKSQAVGEILKEIESQADVKFIYLSSVVNPNQKVSIVVDRVSLDEVLKQLLPNKSVQTKLSGNHIIFYIPAKGIASEEESASKTVSKKTETSAQKQKESKSSGTISIDSLLKLVPTGEVATDSKKSAALKRLDKSKIDSIIERFKEDSVPVVVKSNP